MHELPTRSSASLTVQREAKRSKNPRAAKKPLKRGGEVSADWQRFFKELYAVIDTNGPAPTLCRLPVRACQVAPGQAACCGLSPREIQCLSLAAQGKTSAETAHLLKVKVRTINFHFSNAFAKLQVKNKQAAVALAIQLRYI